uniref:Uncharacterized protein n=1 Tax=Chenopodium quinoa TaxID=63459 RepID=A0A803M467_CHEQI
MARPLPIVSSTLPIHIFSTYFIVFAVLLTLSIFSLVTFLCASHKRQKEEAFTRKKLSISKKSLLESFSKANSISSKALLKIVSWRKQVQHGDEETEYHDINSIHNNIHDDYIILDDDAVWKKTIIKGEKCKPLDFSGKIEYDSEGNLLPDNSVMDDNNSKIISSNKS